MFHFFSSSSFSLSLLSFFFFFGFCFYALTPLSVVKYDGVLKNFGKLFATESHISSGVYLSRGQLNRERSNKIIDTWSSIRERTCLHINSLTRSVSLVLGRFITVHCSTVDSLVFGVRGREAGKKYSVIERIPFPLLDDLDYPAVFHNVVISSLENLP